jgi:hypothetical protein
MIDHQLTRREAVDFGTRLETLCEEFSERERDFLKTVLRLAAADAWAHMNGPLVESSIRDLVLDIHQAGATDAISLNPLPIPPASKGPIA